MSRRWPAPAVLLACAAGAGALDVQRTMDGAGVITIYGIDATVLSVEVPTGPGQAAYLGAGGEVAGTSRYDAVSGAVVFYDRSGAEVGRMMRNWTVGWDHFSPDGRYRGMTVDGLGDVDGAGRLLPEGLFPVPLHWTHRLGQALPATP